MKIFNFIGNFTLYVFEILGGLALMLVESFKWGFRPPYRKGILLEQMEFIGIKSLPVVIMTGIFTGMVFAYQACYGFSMFGAEVYTGAVVALALARELGPVLSSIMVTARAGSAITAELGTMKVTEQIDALYTLGVEPIQYLIAPRVFAGILMMPLLNFVAVIFGIAGGYLVGVYGLDINGTLYMQYTLMHMDMWEILNGTVKAVVFGLILSLVGCYKGFYVSGGALGVGKATTESVVLSCILILCFDYILTSIMF